jgi:hypothetical protein
MRISRANLGVFLFSCVLAATCISASTTNDSPVLGADMPLYPALAWTAKITGKVDVQGVTGADGKVISAQVKSGHPLLSRAVLDNVKDVAIITGTERSYSSRQIRCWSYSHRYSSKIKRRTNLWLP